MASPEDERINLQDLCLKTVGSNLDLFCNAYRAVRQSTEQDQASFVLRRQLECLRRIYTSDLLDKLKKTLVPLTGNHLEFLVNQYAKKLEIERFEDVSVETMKLHLSKAADTLVEISFPDPWAAKDMEDVLATMTNLRSINLKGTLCTDHTLRVIGHSCPLLEELHIPQCWLVTNNGLENLFSSTFFTLPLHTLEAEDNMIGANAIDEEGAAYVLSTASTLKHLLDFNVPRILLNMHMKELRANSLERARKYELVELEFETFSTPPDDILRVCVALCPNVEKVAFAYDGNEEDLRLLAKFEKLRQASLSCFKGLWWPINSFLEVKGTALTSLNLSRVSVCVVELTNFCPNLTRLRLSFVIFSADYKTKKLASLHSLTSLSVEPSDIEGKSGRPAAVALVEASPNLHCLSLSGKIPFCAETVEVILRRAGRLKMVQFCRSKVEMSFLVSLIYCSPMLREIDLFLCPRISESECDFLREHLKIKRSIRFFFDKDCPDSF